MRTFRLILFLLLASYWSAFGKAYFCTESELIKRAVVIAIIDIAEPEEAAADVDSFAGPDSVRVQGRTWTYSQQAKAELKTLIKGEIPKEFTIHGKESFICASCMLAKGRYLAFLTQDEKLWVGANWQLSLRQIRDGKVEWYVSEEQRHPMTFQNLEKVLERVRAELATAEVEEKAQIESAGEPLPK